MAVMIIVITATATDCREGPSVLQEVEGGIYNCPMTALPVYVQVMAEDLTLSAEFEFNAFGF